jgi:S-methylmethionine-dependent homocysteine/selenocysteine methylase
LFKIRKIISDNPQKVRCYFGGFFIIAAAKLAEAQDYENRIDHLEEENKILKAQLEILMKLKG